MAVTQAAQFYYRCAGYWFLAGNSASAAAAASNSGSATAAAAAAAPGAAFTVRLRDVCIPAVRACSRAVV